MSPAKPPRPGKLCIRFFGFDCYALESDRFSEAREEGLYQSLLAEIFSCRGLCWLLGVRSLVEKRKGNRFRPEREFGLIVGGIFVLLGGWWIYRGKFLNAAHVILPLGGLLVIFGLLWPRVLVLPNRAWMLLAEALSFVTTRIILAVVFFLVVTPIGVVKRMMGWDPLSRRSERSESYWKPYSQRQRDPRHYEKMF